MCLNDYSELGILNLTRRLERNLQFFYKEAQKKEVEFFNSTSFTESMFVIYLIYVLYTVVLMVENCGILCANPHPPS